MPCEAQTQTDYSLSDLERLEDLKAVLFDAKQRIEYFIRESGSLRELKRKISDLYLEELRLKPHTSRLSKLQSFGLKIQKYNPKLIVEKGKQQIDPIALLAQQSERMMKKRTAKLNSKRLRRAEAEEQNQGEEEQILIDEGEAKIKRSKIIEKNY